MNEIRSPRINAPAQNVSGAMSEEEIKSSNSHTELELSDIENSGVKMVKEVEEEKEAHGPSLLQDDQVSPGVIEGALGQINDTKHISAQDHLELVNSKFGSKAGLQIVASARSNVRPSARGDRTNGTKKSVTASLKTSTVQSIISNIKSRVDRSSNKQKKKVKMDEAPEAAGLDISKSYRSDLVNQGAQEKIDTKNEIR